MNDAKFVMVAGLAGCGKSTFCKTLMKEEESFVYLSSDELRIDLFGDVDNQDNNAVVFEEMQKRTIESLKKGENVLYDATNLSRKKRRHLLSLLPKKVEKIVIAFVANLETVKKQNSSRERVVPEKVIDRMHKNFQLPIKGEGWDKVVLIPDDKSEQAEFPKQFTDAIRAGVIINREGYDLVFELGRYFDSFADIYDMPHDSKYHCLSVSLHTYYVYRHVLEHYESEDMIDVEAMLWAALLHDTGKHFCKSFYNRKGEHCRYANFIGHENVSAQYAVNVLTMMNFSDEFIEKVTTLVQFHMYLLNEKANEKKLIDLVGQEMFEKLKFLREADFAAH